jgi:imidazolonepropionase-like amidohydrolase
MRGLALALLLFAAPAAQADDIVIHAGRLLDGVSRQARANVSILVRDDRIVAVQDGFVPVPAGARRIDLSAATVLPGLIDCHVHLTEQERKTSRIAESVTRSPLDVALASTGPARRTLEAGFTTVRNLGAPSGIDVALKRAIEAGNVVGPRMFVSGEPLGPSGGHSDPTSGMIPELAHVFGDGFRVDGPEDARRAVREHRKYGADLIKLTVSGGVVSVGDDPNLVLMDVEEVRAAVETAHALGMKVAAHAHGKKAIDAALRLGVDSIEHGSFGDAESFALFKASGAYYVPTLTPSVVALEYFDKHPGAIDPASLEKARAVGPRMQATFAAAYRAGVKIAFGTDISFFSPHGSNAREFGFMVKAGMAPIDAILAATGNAADLLGASATLGSIRPGRFADVIAVAGDPLADVSELERVRFVMKAGKIYKTVE